MCLCLRHEINNKIMWMSSITHVMWHHMTKSLPSQCCCTRWRGLRHQSGTRWTQSFHLNPSSSPKTTTNYVTTYIATYICTWREHFILKKCLWCTSFSKNASYAVPNVDIRKRGNKLLTYVRKPIKGKACGLGRISTNKSNHSNNPVHETRCSFCNA